MNIRLNFHHINRRWLFAAIGCLLALTLAACGPTPERWQWERAEAGLPRQAIILSLAADPLEPDRLWAGYYAANGLATSHDGGQTWVVGAEGLGDNPIFDLLALPPPDGESAGELWAATRTGLLRSVDAGASWQPAAETLPSATAFGLAADAGGRLYVGFDKAGLYVLAPDRSTWQALDGPTSGAMDAPDDAGPLLSSTAILSLDVSPDGHYLYAGTAGQGIFASQDGGRTWVHTYPGEYAPNLVLNPTDPDQAVASLRERLVRTMDGGRSWHTLPLPWAEEEITSLLWLANGTLGAATGRGRLFRSQDSGETWREGGTGLSTSGSVLALVAAGGEVAGSPQRFLAGTWTGVYSSDDGGQSWTELAPSVGGTGAHALLTMGDQLLLGTEAGLFRWQRDAAEWVSVAEAFSSSGVMSLATAPANEQRLYAGTVDDGVYRSDDRGTSWQPVPSPGVGIPALAVDPTEPDHVYMLAIWERVYESRDAGRRWQARWDGLGVLIEALSVAIDPTESVVYVGADQGLYRSDGGRDWELAAPSLADQTILALLAQPLPPSSGGGAVLYIGSTRGVYRSLDGGRTIDQGDPPLGWGHGLENVSVTALLADPEHPERLYAGTAYAGVYQSLDWGQTWQPIGPTALANDLIEGLSWGPDGELFVAAQSGVWRGGRQ